MTTFIKFCLSYYLGVGHATRTIHKGIRSTSANFVANFEKTNLTVRTGVQIDRIILEQNEGDREYKAVGVEAHDCTSGESMIIKAKREIILSAG